MSNKHVITCVTASIFLLVSLGENFAAERGASGHNTRGTELAQAKQYDAAIAEFTKAIQESPKDPLGYTNRGSAYRGSGRLPEAQADFTKAIELAPNDEMAYRERGNVLVKQNDLDGALGDFEKATQLKPDDIAT